MTNGNPHEPLVRRVEVRPPPVRATRETFLEDDALPISAQNVTEGGEGSRLQACGFHYNEA
jgi:hypothetical protein